MKHYFVQANIGSRGHTDEECYLDIVGDIDLDKGFLTLADLKNLNLSADIDSIELFEMTDYAYQLLQQRAGNNDFTSLEKSQPYRMSENTQRSPHIHFGDSAEDTIRFQPGDILVNRNCSAILSAPEKTTIELI